MNQNDFNCQYKCEYVNHEHRACAVSCKGGGLENMHSKILETEW